MAVLLHVIVLLLATVAANGKRTKDGSVFHSDVEATTSAANPGAIAKPNEAAVGSRFINRELSWLAFNERVLAEAEAKRHPLLERLRFLSISMSNLDEFFMVRVAGLTQLSRAGVASPSVDGLTPTQQLARINKACGEVFGKQQSIWAQLKAEMRDDAGIDIVKPDNLTQADWDFLEPVFKNEMWPQLTPQSVDPAHPFPFIANRGMGLMMTLQQRSEAGEEDGHGAAESSAASQQLPAATLTPHKPAVARKMSGGRWKAALDHDDKVAPPPEMKALLLIPPSLPRFVRLPSISKPAATPSHPATPNTASAAVVRPEGTEVDTPDRVRFILIEDLISMKMDTFFPDLHVKEKGMFRVLRDSEVEVDDEAVDLVRMFESALKKRRKGVVILLAVSNDMPSRLQHFLADKLRVERSHIVNIDGLIGLADVKQVIVDDRKTLQFPPFKPRFPERIAQFGGDIFGAIRSKDIVVQHPYESFDVVLQFLRQAARDPDVISIKQTLYRTSHDSPIVKELIEAAESGKTVTALIELKARFDEEANIRWARDMERAGVQVVYGFVELKTHAKVALVMRREKDGLRPYVHFGTGNYHPYTAKIYTDLSLFTADPSLCRDANRLFNFMTSLRKPYDLELLAVAPVNLRTALETQIIEEMDNARAGYPAAIWAKMNSLVDSAIINLLYKASEAGVNVTLIVRGICALRPGVPGLSSRITVKSIVGRFLEHSRIVAFANKHALPSPYAKLYMSSADWMTRNLDWRVEALVPLENPTVHAQVLDQILLRNVEDVMNSWILGSTGQYRRALQNEGNSSAPGVAVPAWGGDAHQYFITHESLSGRGSPSGHGDRDYDDDDEDRGSVGSDDDASTVTIWDDGSSSGSMSDGDMSEQDEARAARWATNE